MSPRPSAANRARARADALGRARARAGAPLPERSTRASAAGWSRRAAPGSSSASRSSRTGRWWRSASRAAVPRWCAADQLGQAGSARSEAAARPPGLAGDGPSGGAPVGREDRGRRYQRRHVRRALQFERTPWTRASARAASPMCSGSGGRERRRDPARRQDRRGWLGQPDRHEHRRGPLHRERDASTGASGRAARRRWRSSACPYEAATAVAVQPDGKIVFTGYEQGSPNFGFYNGLVVRLTSSGASTRASTATASSATTRRRQRLRLAERGRDSERRQDRRRGCGRRGSVRGLPPDQPERFV